MQCMFAIVVQDRRRWRRLGHRLAYGFLLFPFGSVECLRGAFFCATTRARKAQSRADVIAANLLSDAVLKFRWYENEQR